MALDGLIDDVMGEYMIQNNWEYMWKLELVWSFISGNDGDLISSQMKSVQSYSKETYYECHNQQQSTVSIPPDQPHKPFTSFHLHFQVI